MGNVHAIADRTTLLAATNGGRDALVELWRTYQPQLLRFLRARRSLAPEDVASQVWLDVGRAIDRFDGDGRDFQRWIFTIARRRSIDEARRAARRPQLFDDALAEHTDLVDGNEPLDDAGALDRALRIVQALPADMADAVMLRVVYDMPVADVAAAMERSPGSVRVLVHRGLTRLRESLADDDAATSSRRDVLKIVSGL